MNIFSKRPLFTSCMLFIVCTIVGFFISGTAKIIALAISLTSLIFCATMALFRIRSVKRRNIFLLIILCLFMSSLAFLSSYIFFEIKSDIKNARYDDENTIEAIVTSVKRENNFSSEYMITVTKLNGQEEKHYAILSCEYPESLDIGDRISAYVKASAPADLESNFNQKEIYLSDGIFIVYSSNDESSVSLISNTDNQSIEIILNTLNHELSSILTESIPGEAGKLSSALLLGNRSLLSDAVVRDFRRVGASHILALSGMHMSIIMGALMMLLKRLISKREIIVIILSFISIFYLALTGFSLSATRSVIMLLIVYISFLISGLPDSLTALSIAGVLILLISPGAIADAGFWMSFAATLGILVFTPAVNNYLNECLYKFDYKPKFILFKIIFSVLSAITTALAAIIPLIVVMCIFVKEISVFSVLSSLILSIPTAIIILFSLILLPLSGIPFISSGLVFIIRTVANLMLSYCAHFSEFPNIVISLNYPFAVFMALILGLVLFYSFASKHFNPYSSLIPFAICLIIFTGIMHIYDRANDEYVKVSYTNTSSKSDMIVLSNNNESVICDISNGSYTAYLHALNEVKDARSTEIKAIFLTRYTYKHNATLYRVVRSNRVRAIFVPRPTRNEEKAMLDTLYGFSKENGVSVYLYNQGDSLRLLDNAYIEHYNDYIERSVVPIDVLSLYTGTERLTYVSPAYNESSILEDTDYYLSSSQYIIFGSRGPKIKTPYSIRQNNKIKAIIFSNKDAVAYYIPPDRVSNSHYLAEKGNEMEIYLDK